MEYICTKKEIINTGIDMDTVKESKKKPHVTLRDSESIHAKALIDTGTFLKPTSRKIIHARITVTTIKIHVISCAPLIPTFLPKSPEEIEPNKGSSIIAKYINIL